MQMLYVFSVSIEVAYTVVHFFRSLQPDSEVIERKDGTQHILHRGKVKLLMSNVDPVCSHINIEANDVWHLCS